MVHIVSREDLTPEEIEVFAERDELLRQDASKMPVPLKGRFPYLMEINTGFVHVYSEAMAERSDLVIGCYNLDGSTNPEDADPDYDPLAYRTKRDRRVSVDKTGPRNMAEAKAMIARLEKKVTAPQTPVVEEKPQKVRKPRASKKEALPAEPVESPVTEPEQPEVVSQAVEEPVSLEDAFNEAMKQ